MRRLNDPTAGPSGFSASLASIRKPLKEMLPDVGTTSKVTVNKKIKKLKTFSIVPTPPPTTRHTNTHTHREVGGMGKTKCSTPGSSFGVNCLAQQHTGRRLFLEYKTFSVKYAL